MNVLPSLLGPSATAPPAAGRLPRIGSLDGVVVPLFGWAVIDNDVRKRDDRRSVRANRVARSARYAYAMRRADMYSRCMTTDDHGNGMIALASAT
jgi:hypothetical protein